MFSCCFLQTGFCSDDSMLWMQHCICLHPKSMRRCVPLGSFFLYTQANAITASTLLFWPPYVTTIQVNALIYFPIKPLISIFKGCQTTRSCILRSLPSFTFRIMALRSAHSLSVMLSEDILPLIFQHLPCSSYVSASLVCGMWEVILRPFVFGHITTMDPLTMAQCLVLFSGNRNIASYVHSCCFHPQPPRPNSDDVSSFLKYILTMCTNLLSVTMWSVHIEGSGFTDINGLLPLRQLVFQECSWDSATLNYFMLCCTNLRIVNFSTTTLIMNQDAYHRQHRQLWIDKWSGSLDNTNLLLPVSILVQSPHHPLSESFWEMFFLVFDTNNMKELKLIPHPDDSNNAHMLLAFFLPTLTHVDLLVHGECQTVYMLRFVITGFRTITLGKGGKPNTSVFESNKSFSRCAGSDFTDDIAECTVAAADTCV